MLVVIPITLKRAREWVQLHHSHHRPPVGALFSVGVADGSRLACVAIVGRPVARMLDDGMTAEITRVASDGTLHAASKAIAAASRAALALGYRRLVSYTLLGEAGTCYRAAGWHVAGLSAGGPWTRSSRSRTPTGNEGPKARWEFGPGASPPDVTATARVRELSVAAQPGAPVHCPGMGAIP